jgi:hypothetical protein
MPVRRRSSPRTTPTTNAKEVPAVTTTTTRPMTGSELAAIEGRLNVSGLFYSHAHTDVTRLLAEVHRLRTAPTTGPQPVGAAGTPRTDPEETA